MSDVIAVLGKPFVLSQQPGEPIRFVHIGQRRVILFSNDEVIPSLADGVPGLFLLEPVTVYKVVGRLPSDQRTVLGVQESIRNGEPVDVILREWSA